MLQVEPFWRQINVDFPEKVGDVVEVATVEEKIVLIGSWAGSENIFTLEEEENNSSKLKIEWRS